MKARVKKAVIPVAGLGTRFLPVTKTVPKELLPIVDKPILLFIIEEVIRAGIEEVVLIQGRGKEAIENFFDTTSRELEEALNKTGKSHILDELKKLGSQVNVVSVRQHQALGLGHAVHAARAVIEDQPFAVLLGDEIMLPVPGFPSAIGQLCDAYYETGLSSVAVMDVTDEEVSKYGIVAIKESQQRAGCWQVTNVVEKPLLADAPSRLALPGRYIFDAKIFDYLALAKPGRNGEIQLTDAMSELAKNEGLLAMKVKSRRFDAGDKLGFLQANVEIGLEHPEVGRAFKAYLENLVGGFHS